MQLIRRASDSFVHLFLFSLVFLTGCAFGQGGGAKVSLAESRESFLKEFRRIGLNTAPEDAAFLRIMVEASQARNGLEIGSANGYGAMHMGIGFERNRGTLRTIDIDPGMVAECRSNVAKVGLTATVECLEGDALELIPTLAGPFDFVFIDALKTDYLRYFKAVEGKLTERAVIVADNAILYASSMRDFLDEMERHPDYEMVVIQATDSKRDGMAVIYKLR